MGEDVKDPCRIGGDADACKHIAKLAHRRIGKNFLDIPLKHAENSSQQGCENTNPGNYRSRQRIVDIDETEAGNHIDTGCDHGGRMYQC